MAFTATIASIIPVGDGTGSGVVYQTVVNFADSASSFLATKTYNFPVTTTQAAAVAAITADGTAMKATIASAGTLQAKIGSVIVI
jgi:hypothetical protein